MPSCRTERHGYLRGNLGRSGSLRKISGPSPLDQKHTFSAAITAAVNHASPCSQRPFVNSPILLRLPVNMTRGTTAKLNWKERITWLRMRSFSFPAHHEGDDDDGGNDGQGTRNQAAQPGRKADVNEPSITTWPARVPVIEEFWPLARRAMAKIVLAPVTPSSGLSSL